jgi:hypothetical protein
MEKEAEERKECLGCDGLGWVNVDGYPKAFSEDCPVCRGEGTIAAHIQLYAFYNVRRQKLFGELVLRPKTEKPVLRFPEDYAVHAMVEANSILEAVDLAAAGGVLISEFTIVQQPNGERWAQPVAIDYLEH